MLSSLRLAILPLLLANATAQQNPSKSGGGNTQAAGTNNGLMIQLNITALPEVKGVLKKEAKKQLGDDRGWLRILTPGQDPTPKNSCGSLANDSKSLTVMLGSGTATGCHKDYCEILSDSNPSADTKDLLSVERKSTSLVLNAIVFDDDGKVVVALKDNQPHLNKNKAFDWQRPDAHTLDVVNEKNQVVLHIRFLNRNTVYVEGLFYDSVGTSLKIENDKMILTGGKNKGTMNLRNNCIFDSGRASFSF